MNLDCYLESKVLINPETVSPVRRSKKDSRNFYNNFSRYYDWLGGLFERKLTNIALDYLNVQKGERVLEIGIGTGYGLQRIALAVGGSSVSYGIDISEGMIRKTRNTLDKASLLRRVELHQADMP
jgi:ubiquinone/menaquinone biosynthesis C-methylase UbiE